MIASVHFFNFVSLKYKLLELFNCPENIYLITIFFFMADTRNLMACLVRRNERKVKEKMIISCQTKNENEINSL